LIVDKDAVVNVDSISVSSLTVYGTVIGNVQALDKVDMMSGAKVEGDVTAARLRIADGVLFEGKCNMTGTDKEVEIFSRPAEEIKAELLRTANASRGSELPRGNDVSKGSNSSSGAGGGPFEKDG
jgi:cytoskeletal protein CcmA (bactofilin family)